MKEIILTLPYAPSVNHYKKVGRTIRTKNGKMYQQKINSSATNRFYEDSCLIICAYMAINRMKTPIPATISLEVCIDIYPPDKRRRDVDNCAKIILDSLQRGGLLEDDNQIDRLLIQRKEIIQYGKVIIRISELKKEIVNGLFLYIL